MGMKEFDQRAMKQPFICCCLCPCYGKLIQFNRVDMGSSQGSPPKRVWVWGGS